LDVNSTSRITQSNAGNTPNLILATPASNLNLKFFVDQIAAYDNATSSALYLNYNGGDIGLGGTKATLKYATGNFLIGTTTDGGSRLFIKGSGTTSSTSTFLIQNSAGTQALKVFDDTTSIFGDSTTTVSNLSTFYGSIDVKGSSATGAIINMSSASNSAITYAGGSALYIKSGLPNLIFQTNGANERMRIATTGNVLINTTTDAGYKLDVSGTGRFVGLYDSGGLQCSAGFNVIAGSGSSSGKGLLVGTNGLGVNGNSFFANSVYIGGNVTPTSVLTLGGAQGASSGLAVGALFATRLDVSGGNNDVLVGVDIANTLVLYSRTGVQSVGLRTSQSFAPVGLDTTHTSILIAPTINQTGGSTGITRGLYINPTLTAVASWRSIEVATGNVLFNTTSGNTIIGTTTDAGAKLYVKGNGSTSATTAFLVQNSAGTTGFQVADNSLIGIGNTPDTATLPARMKINPSNSKIANIGYFAGGTVPATLNDGDWYLYGGNMWLNSAYSTTATKGILASRMKMTGLQSDYMYASTWAKDFNQFNSSNWATYGWANLVHSGYSYGNTVLGYQPTSVGVDSRMYDGWLQSVNGNNSYDPCAQLYVDMKGSIFARGVGSGAETDWKKALTDNTNKTTTVGSETNYASAKFAIDSTTKGFLPPRMLESNRLAITSPALGLMVYQTDMTEGLYIYKSAGWVFVI
jgi:hypothetical protein